MGIQHFSKIPIGSIVVAKITQPRSLRELKYFFWLCERAFDNNLTGPRKKTFQQKSTCVHGCSSRSANTSSTYSSLVLYYAARDRLDEAPQPNDVLARVGIERT